MIARVVTLLLASSFQGVTGFGFGIITVGLLALVMNPKDATILCTLLALINVSQIFWSVRQHFQWSRLATLALGAVVSMPAAVYLLKGLSESVVIRVMGALLILIVLREILRGTIYYRRPLSLQLVT